jgi:hypothetical protein
VRTDGDIEVHMLLCHRDVGLGLQGLKSFYRVTPEAFALVVHDDGSLDANDRALMSTHFPGVRFVDAADARTRVDAELARLGLERCRELRRTFVLAMRLFDFPLLAAGKMTLQLDPDVIFLERPTELLAALSDSDPRAPMRFNLDVRPVTGYCWTDDEVTSVLGFAPVPQLNAGLVAVRYETSSVPAMWAVLEQCLALPVAPRLRWLTEQTLFGVIAAWRGGAPLAPEYDVCARLRRQGREDLISHHCMAHQRPYFYETFMTRVAPALSARRE